MSAFEMTEGGPANVTVRHLREDHRYSFLVVRRGGRRVLGEMAMSQGGQAARSATFYSSEARAFAESIASKAGLID
jgi:hypothetical protein